MYDCAPTSHTYLSHDMPCHRCGHAAHTYLACSETCACAPVLTSAAWGASPAAPEPLTA